MSPVQAPAELVNVIEEGAVEDLRRLLEQDPKLAHAVVASDVPEDKPVFVLSVRQEEQRVQTVEVLLQAGADPRCTWQDIPLIHWAIDVNGPGGSGEEPFQLFTLLKGYGADLEALGHYGETPLMKAIHCGTVDEVRALVRCGAGISGRYPPEFILEFLAGKTLQEAAEIIDQGAAEIGETEAMATALQAGE